MTGISDEIVPGVWPGVATKRTVVSPSVSVSPSTTPRSFAGNGAGVPICGHVRMCVQSGSPMTIFAPYFVAGTGRFDTLVMERLGERVFCKVGAEGVYCAALPALGLGVAIKMDDGNTARAVEVVMAAVLEALLPMDAAEQAFLRGFSDAPLVNWNGIEVGRLQASAGLREALRS